MLVRVAHRLRLVIQAVSTLLECAVMSDPFPHPARFVMWRPHGRTEYVSALIIFS